MRGGAEIGPRHVDVCCVCAHVHTTRAGPCEGWEYNRARMQLQFLDMLLNLLFVLMVSLMLLLLLSSTRR